MKIILQFNYYKPQINWPPGAQKKIKNIEWGSEYASTKLLSDELRMPHDILRRYSNIYDDILA